MQQQKLAVGELEREPVAARAREARRLWVGCSWRATYPPPTPRRPVRTKHTLPRGLFAAVQTGFLVRITVIVLYTPICLGIKI